MEVRQYVQNPAGFGATVSGPVNEALRRSGGNIENLWAANIYATTGEIYDALGGTGQVVAFYKEEGTIYARLEGRPNYVSINPRRGSLQRIVQEIPSTGLSEQAAAFFRVPENEVP